MKNVYILPTDKPSRLHKIGNELGLTDKPNSNFLAKQHNIYITSDEESKEVDWCLDVFTKTVYKSGKGLAKGQTTLFNSTKKIILTTDPELIADGVQAIDDKFLEWFVQNPDCEEVQVERIYIMDSIAPKNLIKYKIIIPIEEPKYPIGGYAPGNYMCYCVTCNIKFQGDKRASQCEPCAVEMTKGEIQVPNGVIMPTEKLTVDEIVDRYGEHLTEEQTNMLKDVTKPKQETLEEAKDRKYPLTNILHLQLNTAIRTGFEEGAKWQAERMYSEEDLLDAFEAGMMFIGEDKGSFKEYVEQKFKK